MVVLWDHDGESIDFYGQVLDIYAYLHENLVYLFMCNLFDLSTLNLTIKYL